MSFWQRQPLYSRIKPLFAPARTDVLLLHGTAKYSERALSALYIGNRVNLEFLQNLFLRAVTVEKLETALHPLLLQKRVIRKAPHTDLVLTDMPRLLSPLLGVDRDLVVPAWIRQDLVFDDSLASTRLWEWSRSTDREIARLIRRHEYTVDFTSDEQALLEFFFRLYRPYVESRFSSQAIVVTESSFLQHSRGQVLARIHSKGSWTAGMLLKERKRQLRFGWFGAATNPPLAGASEVLDGFCIRYARQRGLTSVVLGNSRPNLNDGVVKYKSKFGARIVPTPFPQAQLGIRILEWRDDIVKCLQQQPLITQEHGRCFVYRVRSNAVGPQYHLDELQSLAN